MMVQFILMFPFIMASILYIVAAVVTSNQFTRWPLRRTVFWSAGMMCALLSLVGPLADQAHTNFTIHMIVHLLLGMLAPLLMVLAAPMTLAFRMLRVDLARRLSHLLKCNLFRFLVHPIVTSFFNIGGLWILYTTNLYALMHQSMVVHVLIHVHLLIAGYLWTASLIYIDPTPHKKSFRFRSTVLLLSLAGHQILSKYIYAFPPNGVPVTQAEIGGMLMYYGGDAIDIVIIFILLQQWYKAARPRTVLVSHS